MKTKVFLLAIISSFCLMIPPVFSFQLNPISQIFSPKGSKATRTYRIVNSANKPIAVEVSVMKREINVLGQETLSPADGDFVIYPAQILMDAKSTQSVRVTWVGESTPRSELSYRLIAEQLPISLASKSEKPGLLDKTTAAVSVLMRYAGSLYVRPDSVISDVVLLETKLERDNKGEKWLTIHLKNQGTARHFFEKTKLMVTVSGKSVMLQDEALSVIDGQIILANGERRFRIPWPTDLPEGDVTGKLILQSK